MNKKYIGILTGLLISLSSISYAQANNFSFPMSLYGTIKDGQSLLGTNTKIELFNSGSKITEYVVSSNGKIGGNTAFDQNIVLNKFDGHILFKITKTDGKIYELSSSGISTVDENCLSSGKLVFLEKSCNIDLNISGLTPIYTPPVNNQSGGGGSGGGGGGGGGSYYTSGINKTTGVQTSSTVAKTSGDLNKPTLKTDKLNIIIKEVENKYLIEQKKILALKSLTGSLVLNNKIIDEINSLYKILEQIDKSPSEKLNNEYKEKLKKIDSLIDEKNNLIKNIGKIETKTLNKTNVDIVYINEIKNNNKNKIVIQTQTKIDKFINKKGRLNEKNTFTVIYNRNNVLLDLNNIANSKNKTEQNKYIKSLKENLEKFNKSLKMK